MHAGTVPITKYGFRMPVDRVAVLLAGALGQVARNPGLVAGASGAPGEYLEFPLPRGNLGVDAFDVDSGVKAGIQVLVDALPPERVAGTHGAVVRALRSGVAAGRETGRQVGAGIPEEVLLFEAEPEVLVVVFDGRATVGLVWRTVRVHHLGHHQVGVAAARVREDRHRFQQQIGRVAFGLRRRTAIEVPHGAFFQRSSEVPLHPRLAAQALGRRYAVQPDVLQLTLHALFVSSVKTHWATRQRRTPAQAESVFGAIPPNSCNTTGHYGLSHVRLSRCNNCARSQRTPARRPSADFVNPSAQMPQSGAS